MTEAYYAQIVAVLLAGGVQARVVHNDAYVGIAVKHTDAGRRIIWANTSGIWGWTLVDMAQGSTKSGLTELDREAAPEDIAIRIAVFDYDGAE